MEGHWFQQFFLSAVYGSKMHQTFLSCLNVFAYLFNPVRDAQSEYYVADGLFLFLDVTETS